MTHEKLLRLLINGVRLFNHILLNYWLIKRNGFIYRITYWLIKRSGFIYRITSTLMASGVIE
jgi:hypothetical protein